MGFVRGGPYFILFYSFSFSSGVLGIWPYVSWILVPGKKCRETGVRKSMAKNSCVSQIHHSWFPILLAWDN